MRNSKQLVAAAFVQVLVCFVNVNRAETAGVDYGADVVSQSRYWRSWPNYGNSTLIVRDDLCWLL